MTQEDKDLLLLRLQYQMSTDNLYQAVNIIIEVLTEVIADIKVQQGANDV